MAKIINFKGPTKNDIDVDTILENTKGQLEGIVIVGYTHDGKEWFASSYGDAKMVSWLLDRGKLKLLEMVDHAND